MGSDPGNMGCDLGNMGCEPTNETVTHRLIDSESTIVLGQYVGSDPGNMGSDSTNETDSYHNAWTIVGQLHRQQGCDSTYETVTIITVLVK